MKLVFATNNDNKLIEVRKMLPSSIELLSLKDISCFEDIDETAMSLQGNAIIKADYISNNYGYDCFADDTGLEIDALNGEPGVYSARYAGENKNSEDNIALVLQKLKNKTNRKAQFRTAICLNINGNQVLFNGACRGEIITGKIGGKGFGYDPIFKPENNNLTFAEMNQEAKNKISHRGLAIRKLVEFLKNTL